MNTKWKTSALNCTLINQANCMFICTLFPSSFLKSEPGRCPWRSHVGEAPAQTRLSMNHTCSFCLSPTRMEMQSNTSKVNMKKRILVIIHIFVFSFDSLHYFRVQQGILRNQALLIQLEQICFFPTKKNMNCRVFFISCIDTIAMSNPVRAKLARDYRWLKASCLPGAEHSQGLTVHVGPPVSSTDHFS